MKSPAPYQGLFAEGVGVRGAMNAKWDFRSLTQSLSVKASFHKLVFYLGVVYIFKYKISSLIGCCASLCKGFTSKPRFRGSKTVKGKLSMLVCSSNNDIKKRQLFMFAEDAARQYLIRQRA